MYKWECQWLFTHTGDETADLGVDWAFLQIVDYCVGNPGQMSHVPSSHTPFWPKHKCTILRKKNKPKNKPTAC